MTGHKPWSADDNSKYLVFIVLHYSFLDSLNYKNVSLAGTILQLYPICHIGNMITLYNISLFSSERLDVISMSQFSSQTIYKLINVCI